VKNTVKILSVLLFLPALMAGRNGIVEKKHNFYNQSFKFISKAPEKNNKPLKINLNFGNNQNKNLLKACTEDITLNPGEPFRGDTTGYPNRFSDGDYPSLGWDEGGPDVVHKITISGNCDFRIHIDPDPIIYPDLDIILIPDFGSGCDTANWYYAGDHTIIYPNAPAGTYYIIVDGYTKEDYGPYTLYTACAKDLLVIDADGSGTSGPKLCGTSYCKDVWANSTYGTNYFYKAALDGMSPAPTYTYWDKTANGGNLPPASTLYNYKSILWFSGQAWGDSDPGTPPKIITANDEEILRNYLNLGGRMMIIGQDILWDYSNGIDGRLPDGSILNDYFQINEVYNDVWTSSDAFIYSTCSSTYASIPLWGVPGSPLGDNYGCDNTFYIFCLFTSGAPFTSYVDSILSRYGEPAYDTYYKSTNDKTLLPAGIRYSASLGIGDWFKTAFLAFSPETNYRTGDTTTVITRLRGLLKRTLDWFEEDDTTTRGADLNVYGLFDDSSGNNNGIPDPGETFNLVLGVENLGRSKIGVKAYEGFEDWYTTLSTTNWCQDFGYINPGSYNEMSFTMTLSSSTPIGYRLQPLFNISEYLTENFEDTDGFDLAGWDHYSISGTPPIDWIWTTAQSQSPTHSWFAQDVDYISDKVLVSPPIYVGHNTTLNFYHRYTFESNCYDGGTLEYAIAPDYSNWTVVPDSWFTAGGFNGTVSSGWENPIGGKRAWCGSQTSWTQVSINLSTLSEKTVIFRWHEGDDNSTGSTGWYVDSINISENYYLTAGFGVFVGQPDVLIVKDEYWLPNTTGVDIYETKIKSIQNPQTGQNYTTAVWDTSLFAAPTYSTYGLPNDFMKNYKFVVWFTGYDFAYTLLPDPWEQYLGINPETELSTFLQNKYTDTGDPARLILSSQDYFYEKYGGRDTNIPQSDFGRVHLKVDFVQQDYIKDRTEIVKGIDGVYSTEKMSMALNNLNDGGYFKNYADLITGDFSEDGTQYLWSYSATGNYSGMTNLRKDRGAKYAFMPFAFENLQDGTPDGFPSKKRFLERIMCQMWMTPSSQYPPCGYSRPTPPYSVTINGIKQGASDAYFTWQQQNFQNCLGEPITGFWRVYGALNNPNRGSFSLLSSTPNNWYVGTEEVPAGSCFYYEVRDWVDAFGTPATSSCP